MLRILIALISGLLFGLGLTISRMIDPAKVIDFLNVTGRWDPSLLLVLITAVAVATIGFRLARNRFAPLCAASFSGPTEKRLDARLALGSVLFGIGWGLVGYCPGPALASLSLAHAPSVLFVASMLAGMLTFSLVDRRSVGRGNADEPDRSGILDYRQTDVS